MKEIVYGNSQGRVYEIVETGKYKGYLWAIGNNRGTYPFAKVYAKDSDPEDDLGIMWTYTNDGDRLGDYRDGKAWTTEEILAQIKKTIETLESAE